jgi:hypothetical protein
LRILEVQKSLAGGVSGRPLWSDFRAANPVNRVIDTVELTARTKAWVSVNN